MRYNGAMSLKYDAPSLYPKTWLAAGFVLLGLAYSVSVRAEDWYADSAFGLNTLSLPAESYAGLPSKLDDKSASTAPNNWKLFGGYRLDRRWAVEMGYRDLGEVAVKKSEAETSALGNQPIIGSETLRDTEGLTVSGAGNLPLGTSLSLFGKVGVMRWTGTPADTARAPIRAGQDALQGLDLTLSAGTEYELAGRVSLRAEWERVLIDQEDVDLFSAGIRLQFE